MLNYLSNHFECLPFLYFLFNKVSVEQHTCNTAPLHARIDSSLPSVFLMYLLISLASIVFDHPPGDTNDVVSHSIFYAHNFLRVQEKKISYSQNIIIPINKGKTQQCHQEKR